MINKEELKEIIVSNERFILEIEEIISREGIVLPSGLKKVGILYGVRRSGKSYILFDLFRKDKEKSLYLDFEDERLANFETKDFERLKETFFELKPELITRKGIIFLFDEVQNIEGWEKFSRRMVEREDIMVFVTGSSSRIMPQEIHTSLRGRGWSLQVFPFSFREYLTANNINVKEKEFIYGNKKALVKNCLASYLKWGGFAEVTFAKSDYEKRKILKEYFEAMFFKDLVERFKVKNIYLLDVLKEKLFSSFSLKVSVSSFFKQYKDKFPFSKDSLYAYLRYFIDSMLIFEVRRLSESVYKRLRNPSKIYLVDTGLARKVTSADSGRLFENVVFLECLRRGGEIFYFQGKNECDLAINRDGKWSAYQITLELNDENREREIKGLVEACKFLGLTEGMIITYEEGGEEKYEGVEITITPAWRWLLR